MWSEYLHNYCREYEYPIEAEQAIISVAQAVTENEQIRKAFEKHLAEYKESYVYSDIEASFWDIHELAKDLPVARETVDLLFFILASEHLKQLYQEAGHPQEYFRGVMLDMRCKLMECYTVHRVWGSFVATWFLEFFALTRFAIGRLQYEVVTMPACISADGEYCFNGETAINIHIPSMGPLKREEIQESIRQAAVFYADHFAGEEVLFTCHSWLLYPGHFKMLPESSGIRRFMDEFTIIRVDIDTTEQNLWRIYGTFDTGNRENLPRNTSLQRAYAEWLEAGLPIGDAVGIKYVKKQ